MEFICQYCVQQFTRKCDLSQHERSCATKSEKERAIRIRRRLSEEQKQQYISEGHYCESCGKLLTEFYSQGLYCSRACANRRVRSDQTKQKISEGVDKHNLENGIIPTKLKHMSYCKYCGKILCLSNSKGYCKECVNGHCSEWATEQTKKKRIEAGKKSAQSQQRRSKNEIAFCELCEQYFTNVTHNQPIFNSWDADIILADYKIAILWNGIWHYKQISKKQSLLQVQTRDKIKIDQIISCGYTPYIIKDMGKADKHKVENEFYEFVRWLNDKNLCQHNN